MPPQQRLPDDEKPTARGYQPFKDANPRLDNTPPPPTLPDQFLGASNKRRARRPRLYQQQPQPTAPRTFKPRLPLPRIAVPRFAIGPIVGYVVLTGVVVGVLILLFIATRVFNVLGGISVARQDGQGNVVSGSSITGHGRVNIILLGLDRRPNAVDGTRSDSMILISIDQDNKTANMLSVPRDLWLKIPGHDSNRVNSAYFFGDQANPGKGGPPLVKQMIQENFGIRVDYFAEIDFNGFRSIIDSIGGITIDVKKPLVDNEYPTEDYGIKRIHIPAGIQHMSGEIALEYARSRHSDSDLGRNQRQQEVLLAVREQGTNLGLLTNTQLQAALQGTFKTDLTTGDILALGQIAVGLRRDAIKQFSIDANITHNATVNGNEVLEADPTALQQLLNNFLAAAPAPTALPNNDNKETVRLSVLNGTFVSGRAATTQKFLEGKGYTVASIDQASDAGQYPHTVINVYTGKNRTATELATLLGLDKAQIRQKSGGPVGIDLEIVCGDDLKLP